MSDPIPEAVNAEFARRVQDALNLLYDSVALQSHPLAVDLCPGETNPLRRSQKLRSALLEGIQALRPAPGCPAHSPDWRAYRLLELRYIEGLDPNDVMDELALAKSQYYREQGRALQALIAVLWDRTEQLRSPDGAPDALLSAAQQATQDLVRAEATRVSTHGGRGRLPEVDLLADLQTIVGPLAQNRGVDLRLVPPAFLTGLAVDRVLVRQALLAAISAALNLPGVTHLEVSGLAMPGERGLRVGAWPSPAQGLATAEVDLCRSLLEATGGALKLLHAGDSWDLHLTWPAVAERSLLVIDDNEGLAELFRRYLAGSVWRLVSAENGQAARHAIAEAQPDVITLDVMMPQEDGWDLLLALKTGTDTRAIPVIICSVLNQPEIATTLGAVAYLPKPVTQQALLDALAPWT